MASVSDRRRTGRPFLLRDCVMRDYGHVIATLAGARESQGRSLAELAERTDCGRSTLSVNLRGLHRMDAVTLLQLADALGYDLALIPREDT